MYVVVERKQRFEANMLTVENIEHPLYNFNKSQMPWRHSLSVRASIYLSGIIKSIDKW